VSVTVSDDVVVVTGGAGGLGAAYCRMLASYGARVVVNDTGGVVDGKGGDPEAAQRVVDAIVAVGGTAVADSHDGSKLDGAAAIVQTALDAFGRIDAVVANAGILRDRSFAKISDEDFFAVIEAHLVGTTRIFHAAWPLMREQGYGRLVATTSASGLFGNFGQSNYGAAKMGIVGLTQALAIEGAKNGIHANVVAPVAQTRMSEGLMGALEGKASPDLVAPLVAWLVSRECDLTGRIFSVGVGRIARVDVGVTRGLTNTELTPEWVGDNIHRIDDEQGYVFPATASDEMKMLA
jgi:NAD(P)-dependent dehydrogenase (short-subunit alcohol dehydrogenase family)